MLSGVGIPGFKYAREKRGDPFAVTELLSDMSSKILLYNASDSELQSQEFRVGSFLTHINGNCICSVVSSVDIWRLLHSNELDSVGYVNTIEQWRMIKRKEKTQQNRRKETTEQLSIDKNGFSNKGYILCFCFPLLIVY